MKASTIGLNARRYAIIKLAETLTLSKFSNNIVL